ncbi:MAG: acylphosphatase [Candidatus Omnitrophota bacterium]
MRKRLRAIFLGMVQGVGFRFTTQRLARQYPVTGFVRNRSDGGVEVLAEGDEDDLREFLGAIQASPLSSYIRESHIEWADATGQFQHFEITF